MQSTAHADGAEAGRAGKGATVYADSFRHVIYNTLRTSNRLIKYILYKYISYCTRCPLVQPLRPRSPLKPRRARQKRRLHSSHLAFHTCHSTLAGWGRMARNLLPLSSNYGKTDESPKYNSKPTSPTVGVRSKQTERKKKKNREKPPCFNVLTFHALSTQRRRGACPEGGLRPAGRSGWTASHTLETMLNLYKPLSLTCIAA